MAAARDGNRSALETLLRRHYERCYAVCRRLLGDDQDALDATQEAMIAISRGVSTFDGRSAFTTWTYRIATNAALDELRRRRRRPVTESSHESAGADEKISNLAETGRTDGVGEAVAARMMLDRALEQVSEEHRTAVVLRDMMDLDYAEIAEVLRVPIGTVRSRIARGRAALAQALEPTYEAFGRQAPHEAPSDEPPSHDVPGTQAPNDAPTHEETKPGRPNPAARSAKAANPRAPNPKAPSRKAANPKAANPKAPNPKAASAKAASARAPNPRAPKQKPQSPDAAVPKAPDQEAPDHEAPDHEAPDHEAPVQQARDPTEPNPQAADPKGNSTPAPGVQMDKP